MTPEQRQQLTSAQAAAQARNREAFSLNPNLQIWLRQVRIAAVIRRTARNLERWKMNDDEKYKQWAKLCRMYITRGNAEIDQIVSELHAMAGIREGFEDMDAWEAMHDRAVQDAESQRPNSPEYAWALLRVLGVKLWMVRALEAMEEGADG